MVVTTGKQTAADTTKKTKAKPAPKPKQRVKKPLSEEAKLKIQKKELKEAALFAEPKGKPDNSWALFVAEETKGKNARLSALLGLTRTPTRSGLLREAVRRV